MLELESIALIDEKCEALKALFPEIFTDGKIDVDALKTIFGDEVDSTKEKYRFTWNGKRDLFSLINKKSSGTLKPDISKSLHFETAQNAIIEGDNLEALKLLGAAYHRRVKMIYIDPPYNKQKDFVYPDNWSDPLESYLMQTGQKDEFGLTSSYQDKTGRLHTNWLNMIYPRLYLARNLLRDDGVIFVSIDDDEVHNLRKVMDEIFGEENFEGHIHWRRRHNQPNDKTKMIAIVAEHILVYAKNKQYFKEVGVGKVALTGNFSNPDNDPKGDWASKPWKVGSDQSGSRYKITTPSGKILDDEWMGDIDTYYEFLDEGRIYFPNNGDGFPRKKYYKFEREIEGQCATNWWNHDVFGHNQEANDETEELFGVRNIFSNPKPTKLVRNLMQIANTKDDDIILDFFAGSGTTAHAVMAQNAADGGNRRYILVQIPEALPENSEARKMKFETIADITTERVRRAANALGDTSGFRYFRLDRSHFRVFDQIKYEKGKSSEEVLKLLHMSMFVDNTMMSGWTKVGVAFETALKNGLGLSSSYTVEKRENYTLHILEEGGRIFTFCFDDAVKEDIAKLLPAGSKFVCFDKALTDSVKLNIATQIGTENIETI